MPDRSPGFLQRTALAVGAGARHELGPALLRLGAERPGLLIDPNLVGTPVHEAVRAVLPDAPVIAADAGEPTCASVFAAAERVALAGVDGIVAVGGGSTIDTAKLARGLLLTGVQRPTELPGRLDGSPLPLIAMPTTAGTGAEVGAGAIVHDEAAGEKVLVRRAELAADVALADGELTAGLPPHLTAYTGLDAFAQALMAYVPAGPASLSGQTAIAALRLIREALPVAVTRGGDRAARDRMMLGSVMSAVAMYNAPPDYAGEHVFAEPVGPALGVHHGHAVAALLPGTLAFNRPVLEGRLAELGRALGAAAAEADDATAAAALVKEVRELVRSLGVSPLPAGVDRLDDLARRCERHEGYALNPRPLDHEATVAILAGACDGSFDVAPTPAQAVPHGA